MVTMPVPTSSSANYLTAAAANRMRAANLPFNNTIANLKPCKISPTVQLFMKNQLNLDVVRPIASPVKLEANLLADNKGLEGIRNLENTLKGNILQLHNKSNLRVYKIMSLFGPDSFDFQAAMSFKLKFVFLMSPSVKGFKDIFRAKVPPENNRFNQGESMINGLAILGDKENMESFNTTFKSLANTPLSTLSEEEMLIERMCMRMFQRQYIK